MNSMARWVLGVAAAVSFASAVQAYPFVTRSDFLREKRLRLFLVKSGQGRVLLPLLEEPAAAAKPMALLGNDGRLHKLTGDLTHKTGVWDDGCGHERDVAALALEEKSLTRGRLVVVGEDAEAQVRWTHAGREVKEKAPACLTTKSGFALRAYHTYETMLGKQKIYFAEWEALPLKEPSAGVHCGVGAVESVGLVSQDGTLCAELNTLERDCHWLPMDRVAHSARELEGILTLGGGAETWLIFQSVGHESSGFTALPYSEGKPTDNAKIDEVHDNGC